MALTFEWDPNKADENFKGDFMRRHKTKAAGLRPEYDLYKFKNGVRGKYAHRYHAGTNLIHLEPDVAKVFLDDASVNQALRSLIRLAKVQTAHNR